MLHIPKDTAKENTTDNNPPWDYNAVLEDAGPGGNTITVQVWGTKKEQYSSSWLRKSPTNVCWIIIIRSIIDFKWAANPNVGF